MKHLIRSLLAVVLLTPLLAHALTLAELSAQLAKPAVIRGPFVQEKHLRSLPQPLTSTGQFVLARDHGLLWLLRAPLQQDYRIDDAGIARRDANGWQTLPARSAGAQQNHLFFAVLRGDSSQLEHDFELSVQGTAEHWQVSLVPRSLLLKQVFDHIELSGGQFVERIELFETQGDRTVLRMPSSQASDALSEQEQHDFAR
ncbi:MULTISPECIES: outer membrane lipoprotein carrier protein LolA [unclassified Pseudomonas]|uniref:outer membrane lipoprotein carrier protein LolA n=1 Tax=unclassified Pseudomonas TaxID=196821 RepID=UPI000BCBD4AB|nr:MULTISPECIES: outer membrane lipoprotein carrier protein LolA [unclassified Pseudomonas]PVZ15483.1 outer membrane lipoprotein carrier protein LolA [Pseudomonas sp. URIL14HWK12:I12]PVZ24857.1 outer membrane lipoprotein carrier protein LolA [Pseudomonas sp. URIL14HWK12:I10]PVZ34703.1 outer membrane lipoprotein carrier protein LolA [Pseudomonas sp. URIL14HWK12:I11]SNZ09014.1 Outer membrane lipoprotein carrier protein LolA [Pseudomonas sp. URIL14HWK12:I9]